MAIGGGGLSGGGQTNIGIRVETNIDQSIRQFNQLNQTINNFAAKSTRNIDRIGTSFKGLDLHMRRINANAVLLGFAFAGLAGKAGDFFERGAKMELFSKQMETVSGSAVEAQKDIAEIITLSKSVPVSLETLTKAFIKLKSAGIDPITKADGSGPLKAMAEALAAFGGTDEQFDRAINSITQMAGKGKVMMEELRQQLGEAIPTAIRVFARELNMTVAEFFDAVSKGAITADKLDDLFRGFEKTYGGSSLKILQTWTGATQQLDTALSILAKTIFVDTQTMRYFTAGVQLLTEQIFKLDEFLKTAEGQEYINGLWENFKELALYAERALSPVKSIYEILKNVTTTAATLTGGMPEEIVGGGVLGFLLFGRAGIIPGALFGAFNKELASASTAITGFLTNVDGTFNKFGGAIANAAVGGMIGFRLAGPKGALVGALIGAFAAAEPEITKFVQFTNQKIAELSDPRPVFDIGDNALSESDYNKQLEIYENKVRAWEARMKGISPDVGPKADIAPMADSFMKEALAQAQAKADAIKQVITKVYEGISEETVRASKSVNVKILDAEELFPTKEEAIAKLTELESASLDKIAQLQDRATELGNQVNRAAMQGIDAGPLKQQLEEVNQELLRMGEVRDQAITKIGEIKLLPENLVDQIDASGDAMINWISKFDTSFQSVEQARAGLAEFSEQIKLNSEALEQSGLSKEQQAELTAVLAEQERQLASATEMVNKKFAETPPIIEENAVKNQQLANSISDLQQRANNLNVGGKFTDTAAEMTAAQGRIDNLLGDIKLKILQIDEMLSKGLISQTTRDTSVANLQAIAAQVEATRGKMVSSAGQIDQAWQQLGSSIQSAMETALGDAIYGLVTKTKSLKEVMLDFWNSITRAVSNYIAKLIMGGLFGGGAAGGGGIFGSIFGTAGAAGPSMMSTTGPMAMAASAATSKGRGYQPMSVTIHAIDAPGVQQLFMKHGSTLHASIQHRQRLNHQ